ncbi:MAG: c-type cytochrome domain-containing protein [Planctomycetaceae bacterium]
MSSVFSTRLIPIGIGLLLLSSSTLIGQEPDLHEKLAANRSAIARAKQELEANQQRSVAMANQLQQLKDSVTSGEHELQALAATEAQLKEQHAVATREADRLKVIASKARARRDAQATLATKLQQDLLRLEEQLLLATQSGSQAQRKLDGAKAELKTKKAAVEKAKAIHQKSADAVAAALAAKERSDKRLSVAKEVLAANQKSVETLAASSKGIQPAIAALSKSATLLQSASKENPKDAALAAQAKSAATTLDQLKAAATAVTKAATTSAKEFEKAKSNVETVTEQAAVTKATLAKAAAAAMKPATTLKNATDALIATQGLIQESNKVLADSTRRTQVLSARIVGLRPSVRKSKLELSRLQQTFVSRQKQLESSLKVIGQFVSFSKEIAPIFKERCVACHNSRDTGGSFNMESLATMHKGGESGMAFEPGKAAESYLLELIKDGEMPQESDPLSAKQVELVRRWIDVGAPLDAGIQPEARLVEIIPKEPQPLPPQTYKRPVPVTAIAFSPDGKLLATSGYHEVLIWNAANGDLLRRVTNVAERIHDIEFSRDAKTIAVAAGTPAQIGEAKLFAVADGQLLHDFLRADDSAFSVAFSPDETQLAVGSADNRIRVFEIETGELVLNIDEHSDWVTDVKWSEDGQFLASSSRDKTAKLFDAKSGEPLRTFNGHTSTVYSIDFSANDTRLVTASGDRQIKIWNVKDGKEARRIRGFGNEVCGVALTNDGKIASVSADKTARLHEAKNGREVRKFSGHADWVYSVATAGERLATGSYDGQVRIWNLTDGKQVLAFIAQPETAETATASR